MMLALILDSRSEDAEASGSVAVNLRAGEELGDLREILGEIQAMVAPLWPLKDYVAVNPYLGLADRRFLDARQVLRQVRDCELLPPASYYRSRWEQGDISTVDVEAALGQCREEYPELYGSLTAAEILEWLAGSESAGAADERRVFTVAEVVDRRLGSSWASHIVNDISRHCAAHYDEGQASWPSPWKDLPLYEAWLETAKLSRRMELLGLGGFRDLVVRLPKGPTEAIARLLTLLEVPPSHWRSFLLGEVLSLAGWASYIKHRVQHKQSAERKRDDLLGLLAIRLAYDAALARTFDRPWAPEAFPGVGEATGAVPDDALAPSRDGLARYSLQVAVEVAYRRRLGETLAGNPRPVRPLGRKTLQMVFCIDVRSEVMRRHLESVSEQIETFGFAGFFGMAFEYVPLGEKAGAAQCPVLLEPGFRVHERLRGADEERQALAVGRRGALRAGRKLWKSFQTSAASCFSFVESLGLTYFAKLLTDSLRLTRPVAAAEGDGVPAGARARLGPDLHAHGVDSLPSERRADLAEAMLRNLGLTSGFARIVALCGHAADVVNNPYKAGLDCGACGGHSGEPNARVAATLLNDGSVRAALAARGISIPADTWFVPAVHNTTTDEIRWLDAGDVPQTHQAEFQQVQAWTREAGARSRLERSPRLDSATPDDAFRRSRDWAEVRPEWGLAGNAAFLVMPRSRTAGLDLGGRAFLHSYDHRQDPGGKVLELIMTAPMIVTSWINLQYYASAVDNRAFGSGNKTLHNVVGQLGVLQGNGGDLMTGLPWQSVHDGTRLQHPPQRLLVAIEAPRAAVQRVIDKHAMVRDLVGNGWLTLAVADQGRFHRWSAGGVWHEEDGATASGGAPASR